MEKNSDISKVLTLLLSLQDEEVEDQKKVNDFPSHKKEDAESEVIHLGIFS